MHYVKIQCKLSYTVLFRFQRNKTCVLRDHFVNGNTVIYKEMINDNSLLWTFHIHLKDYIKKNIAE